MKLKENRMTDKPQEKDPEDNNINMNHQTKIHNISNPNK